MSDFIEVKSGHISGVKYNEYKSLLTIRFVSDVAGAKSYYEYAGFPKHKFNDFITAKSKGGYFYRMIKGQYEYENVTEDYANE